MRKISFYLLLSVLLPLTTNAQEAVVANTKNNLNYASTFGISYGIDDDINAFRLSPNGYGNTFYKATAHYNIGINYGWMISKKVRPRIEINYVNESYGATWENANINSITKTTVNLYNVNLSFHLDYMLVNSNNFQLFVSPALKWEFNVARDEKNILDDGTHDWANYNGIIAENLRNNVGASVSTILKYNITKGLGITLTPDYTLFVRKFVPSNDKLYQRLSINLGVEFNFL